MNKEQVEQLKKAYSSPSSVQYVIINEKFRQVFTMDDIEKPGKDLCDYHVCDLMTLGRAIPEYEDWARGYMEMALVSKQRTAGYLLTTETLSIESFDDIEQFYNDNCDNIAFNRFTDERLNEYFEIRY